MKFKYEQNWVNRFERMDNIRLPKHALKCKPRGQRDHGSPKKNGNVPIPEKVKSPNLWRRTKKKKMKKKKKMVVIFLFFVAISNK